jgi:hypothetical protein
MSDTFNYTLIKNDEGNFVVRSTVKSFNLDHVTDKDIVSFYKNFSEVASFDTGLLPLDGTGVLAIRTAGFHTQIVTQHAPGHYHVNWGAHEGDVSAKTYYVAQPYRVVIGDFENGNLLGARMFYSPYPITSPNNQLYHVNLPNINCKGYRGNGVGWICLYHKDDWSHLPFNEKVARFIERCSGVETYNDANMSETDGPRFYASKGKPTYFTDPSQWQDMSTVKGYQWTLDEDLLIPVLVQDMDHQDKHVDGGQPLTLAMAMLGSYQAYYSDKSIPKHYNIVSRSDMDLNNENIGSFFKRSFAVAPVSYSHNAKDDPYNFTLSHREKNGSATLDPFVTHNVSQWVCDSCEESFSDDYSSNSVYSGNQQVCDDCYQEQYIYIQSAETHFHYDDSNLHYIESSSEYFHEDYDSIDSCGECGEKYAASGKTLHSQNLLQKNFYPIQDDKSFCLDCFKGLIDSEELNPGSCFSCSRTIVHNETGWNNIYPTVNALVPDESGVMSMKYVSFCNLCKHNHVICPCGLIKDPSSVNAANCTPTPIDSIVNPSIIASSSKLTVNQCCDTCLGPISFEDSELKANFVPFNIENFKLAVQTHYYQNVPYISSEQHDDIF